MGLTVSDGLADKVVACWWPDKSMCRCLCA